jgi:translation initiation factor 3 subunit C
MSPTNAKALNTMRQRLKKHNMQYTEQMNKFRENPASTEEEPEPEDADDDSSISGDDDRDDRGSDHDNEGFETKQVG